MNDNNRLATATAAAFQATVPIREALIKARVAFVASKEDISRLEAKHLKVWDDTVSQSLKEGE